MTLSGLGALKPEVQIKESALNNFTFVKVSERDWKTQDGKIQGKIYGIGIARDDNDYGESGESLNAYEKLNVKMAGDSFSPIPKNGRVKLERITKFKFYNEAYGKAEVSVEADVVYVPKPKTEV